MKMLLSIVATAIIATATFAEESTPDLKKMSPEERKAYHDKMANELHGGYVSVKGTPSGSIVVVNAQKRVGADNFYISKYSACKWLDDVVTIVDGEAPSIASAAALKQKLRADFAIFIVDDSALPPSLVAVEAQWAILNVGALASGGANEEIVRIRAKNEFSRVFSLLCGGFCSQYPAPLINFIVNVSDLDKCLADPPGDILIRMKGYLEKRGVQPERKVLYRRACQEGWAPAPTNDVQKAIWDKVHAIPDKPITIEFDPKKDK